MLLPRRLSSGGEFPPVTGGPRMAQNYFVSLAKIIEEFSLETVYMAGDPGNIMIGTADLNRPGLALSGFFEYFDANRIQIIGRNESSFLASFPWV